MVRMCQVRTNMQAVLLVAAHKGSGGDARPLRRCPRVLPGVKAWPAGSGHTRPGHPMMADVASRLNCFARASFTGALEAAHGQPLPAPATELETVPETPQAEAEDIARPQDPEAPQGPRAAPNVDSSPSPPH